MSVDNKYRPPAEERWTDGFRTEPVLISARTEWLYSERDSRVLLPAGRTRHVFCRRAEVTASDVPDGPKHMQDIGSHLCRAIAAFGDDKDLVIEVRLSDDKHAAHSAWLWEQADAIIGEMTAPELSGIVRSFTELLLGPRKDPTNDN